MGCGIGKLNHRLYHRLPLKSHIRASVPSSLLRSPCLFLSRDECCIRLPMVADADPRVGLHPALVCLLTALQRRHASTHFGGTTRHVWQGSFRLSADHARHSPYTSPHGVKEMSSRSGWWSASWVSPSPLASPGSVSLPALISERWLDPDRQSLPCRCVDSHSVQVDQVHP
jgi:hypothetical protein